GETICLPVMSATRLSGLALAALTVWIGGSLFLVACAAVAGEGLAFTVGLLLLSKLRKIHLRTCLLPAGFVGIALGAVAVIKAEFRPISSPVFWLTFLCVAWVVLAAGFAAI